MSMSLDPMSIVADNNYDLISTVGNFCGPEGSGGQNNQQSSDKSDQMQNAAGMAMKAAVLM